MNPLRGFATPSPDSLREQWRTASIETTWLQPGDWYHPAVDALVEALCERRSVAPAAERLGRGRAEAGVGMAETINDVACLYRARGLVPDLELVRAIAIGWVGGYESTPVAPQFTDPESGLATTGYFQQRLRETYGQLNREEHPVRRGLLIVDMTMDGLTVWERSARVAAAGQVLTGHFGDGYPMAALGHGMFVVLVERGDDERATHSKIRFDIERTVLGMGITSILRNPPRMWIEPLPTTHAFAVELLRDLKR